MWYNGGDSMSPHNPDIRVRFAPSPTGPMTLGNARTALFNWLYARKTGGTFIVRIEDTDTVRSTKEHEYNLLESLRWIGIAWDEGPVGDGRDEKETGPYNPYHQSNRSSIYEKYINQLLEEKKAYLCYCTPDELAREKEKAIQEGRPYIYSGRCRSRAETSTDETLPRVIRFQVPEKIISFVDMIRGEVSFDTKTIGDIVIAKTPQTPLFNFAVIVDDYLMKISHVIRGEDHIANTPKQIAIAEALGFSVPQYAHLPLMLAADRTKLSKRTADTSILRYREEGYLPEAIMNFLALLGWHPKDDKEVFSPMELIEAFELERVQKAGAIFNPEKLDWMNGQHIKRLSLPDLYQKLQPFIPRESAHAFSPEDIGKMVALHQDRLLKLADFRDQCAFFFAVPEYESSLLIWKDAPVDLVREILQAIRALFENIADSEFTADELPKKLDSLTTLHGNGNVLWPLRVALSGLKGSVGPFAIADIIKKEETIRRIDLALSKLSS